MCAEKGMAADVCEVVLRSLGFDEHRGHRMNECAPSAVRLRLIPRPLLPRVFCPFSYLTNNFFQVSQPDIIYTGSRFGNPPTARGQIDDGRRQRMGWSLWLYALRAAAVIKEKLWGEKKIENRSIAKSW
jgi:hypothetical protein